MYIRTIKTRNLNFFQYLSSRNVEAHPLRTTVALGYNRYNKIAVLLVLTAKTTSITQWGKFGISFFYIVSYSGQMTTPEKGRNM